MKELTEYVQKPIRVVDKITGFTGIVIGHADYITGCDQYLVAPKVSESGDWKDSKWFDVNRLEIVEFKLEVKISTEEDKGSDISAPNK